MTDAAALKPQPRAFHILLYGAMLATVVVAFLAIRVFGERLSAPVAQPGTIYGQASGQLDVNALLHVLLALAVIIALARLLGTIFRAAHQPPVVGEIVAGILLGPSLLGRLAPSISQYLLPTMVAPFLNVISEVGVILFMFLVGVELDPGLIRQR